MNEQGTIQETTEDLNSGVTTGASATANLTFGNPKNQCIGAGICSMPKASARSGNGVLATVKVIGQTPPMGGGFTANLTLNLGPDSLSWLSINRPAIFTALTTQPSYTPEVGGPGVEPALPFTLEQNLASALFTPLCINATIPSTSSPWLLQQIPQVGPFTNVIITINGVAVAGGS